MNRKKILILRPDNIGDVMLFTGALRHIRNLYPQAHITLAVQAHILNLVELCPYVDTCVPVGHLTWWGKMQNAHFLFKHKVSQAIRVVNKLWNSIIRPFDIVMYPVKSPQVSYLKVVCFLNAIQTFGISGCSLNSPKNGYPSEIQPKALFTKHLDVSSAEPWAHELSTTADFLIAAGCCGITTKDIQPEFWLAESEKNHLDGVQKNKRKIIGLFPGASWRGRCWESRNYGELARLLGGRTIYVIFGSSSDKDLADQVVLAIKERCKDAEILNLTGLTTLRELAKTIMHCDLFIGMETSGLHVAIATGVPTIGIVGGGHFGRFAPWGNPVQHVCLTKHMECFNCKWQCTKEKVECVQGVSPQEVALAVAKLLEQENLQEKQCN